VRRPARISALLLVASPRLPAFASTSPFEGHQCKCRTGLHRVHPIPLHRDIDRAREAATKRCSDDSSDGKGFLMAEDGTARQAEGGWHSTDARDGCRLVYKLIKGRGAGRLALCHSLAMDGSFWDRVVPLLAADADILVYDARGHGRSAKPAGPYTVELFADDLAGLFDAVGWRSAVVAGASMGGCVALAFGAAYPARVDGLGLIDTTAWYGADAPAKWEERAGKALTEGLGALIEFQTSRWFTDAFREAHPDIVERAVRVFLANDVRAYAETCRMLGAADKRAAMTAFRFPCQVIVGREDYASPVAMAEAMAGAIPGARLHIIENARHLTPLEVPDIVAADLRGLLQARAHA